MPKESEFRFNIELLNHLKFGRNNEAKLMLDEELVKKSDGFGTLLHRAAVYDNVEIVEHLIKRGSDVNFLGGGGKTPLMIAVKNENLATVKVLLAGKADVDIVDAKGRNVLQMAFHEEYFNAEIIEVFLRKLQTEYHDKTRLLFKLSDYNCAPRHAIILRNARVITGLLAFTSHSYSRKEEELHATFQQDKTTIFYCLELNSDSNDQNEEGVIYSTVSGAVLLHSKENNDRFGSYSNHLGEHGILDPESSGYSYATRCLDSGTRFFWHRLNNAKTLMAHIAVLEKLGKSIFKTAKCLKTGWYDGEPIFTEKYHELCQEILNKRMFENSTLLDLFIDRDDQMRIFVRNKTFTRIIEEVSSEYQLKKLFPYYYEKLMSNLKSANAIVKLEDKAIAVISKIFSSNCNECYNFARQVVSYLNKNDLKRLCILCDLIRL